MIGQEKSTAELKKTKESGEAKEKKSDSDKDTPKKETIVTTKHSIVIDGKTVAYEAVAGKLPIKDDAQKSKAEMFFIAYTRSGVAELGKRPVTFCFNGGPGSSSVWLHLGMLGPKRIRFPDDATPLRAPYSLEENSLSMLDVTDLVFIDPVSTGYSRPADGEEKSQFHGYEEDLRSVGQFIHDWTTKYQRWLSPKFVLGESYGGVRAAGLSGYLQDRYYMELNGAIIVSGVINFQTLRFGGSNDLPYITFLPTYAATAWYHQKLDKSLQAKPLRAFLDEVEAFVESEYNPALFKGDKLAPAKRTAIAKKISHYTGLSVAYIEQANLRISIHRFCKELCRDEHRTVGRLDSRFKGIDRDAAGENIEYDPAHSNLDGAYAACLNDYVRRELKFESDTPYKVISQLYLTWNFGADNQHLNVAETLRKAMNMNPHMKVYVGSGYFDLATPHFATDYVLNHMALDSSLVGNLDLHYYEAGHMMYIHMPSLKAQAKHLRDFVRKAK